MVCAPFEDRLLDYEELSAPQRAVVDAHLTECPSCREYLQVLAAMDVGLTRLYADAALSPEFRSQTAGLAPGKLSWVPEMLDFLGWAGVIALVVYLLLFFGPMQALFIPVLIAAAVFSALAAAWVCLRSFAELGG